MKAGKQTTLRRRAELSGTGVHSGLPVSIALLPAEADTGIVFLYSVDGASEREVRACARSVAATEFATVLGDDAGPVVATVEHVMAALHALGVDNATVEIDGPEVPIFDGSAQPFVSLIDAAGIVALRAPRRYLRVLKPIGVVAGESYGELRPYDGFRLEIEIDFEHALIGRQDIALDVDAVTFRRELARARTFGFFNDVERLWNSGYALGATVENTVVIAEDRLLNPEGLRFANEFVRHKALDALGDLALAGAPILGAYRSVRGGHRLNHAVLCALLADTSAWTMVEARERHVREAVRRPAQRTLGHVDLGLGLMQPAFAPEIS